MSLNFDSTELSFINNQCKTDGDLADIIDSLNYQLEQLNIQKNTLSTDSTIHQKFYDWWTKLTTYSEEEEKWSRGDYVTEPVTNTIIYNSALGEETILFPYSSNYDKLYPKRVSALYGTDATGYDDTAGGNLGPYEWGEIQNEQDSTLTEWLEPVQSQKNALENHIIPNIQNFINEAESEPDYSSILNDLISAAKTSLSDASTALANANSAIASWPTYPSGRASYITSRKIQIENRINWIDNNHDELYNKRYLWLNLRINRSFGIYSDYLSIDDTIDIVTQERDAMVDKLNEMKKIL